MRSSNALICATALAAALGMPRVQAADAPGARPGDDALSCEQLYAEASAQSQHDQAERRQHNDERQREGNATAALVTGAMLSGGLGGLAAQAAVEAQAKSAMAEAAAPPSPDARMARLRQLWTQKHCVHDAGAANATTADAASIGCAQIAAELVPYVQQVAPNAQAIAATQQREFDRGLAKHAERQPVHQLLAGMATAAAFDPTGAAQRAYAAAEMAQAAKERSEDAAEAASPEAQRGKAQRGRIAAQAQAMQADARLQQLLQLGRENGCDGAR